MPNVGKYRGISIYHDTARNRFRMWFTDNEKNKKPVYGKTKEEVKKNYDEVQEALRKKKYIPKKPDTLNSLMTDMLQEKAKKVKTNSLNRDKDTQKIIQRNDQYNKQTYTKPKSR